MSQLIYLMAGTLALHTAALESESCAQIASPVESMHGKIFKFVDGTLATVMSDYERALLFKMLIAVACFLIIAEVVFFIVVYFHLLPSLQRLTKPHAYPTCTVKYMKRVLDLVKSIKGYTVQEYFSGFFRGASFEDLHQGNLTSFLAWAMFGKRRRELTAEDADQIAQVAAYAMEIHPELRTVKPGFNPKVRHCRMTYEPIPTIHRPLMTYVIVAIMEALANLIFLRLRGFQRLEVDGLTYWYRKGSRSAATAASNSATSEETPSSTGEEPVVFLHGIATGWMLYLQLARAVSKGRTLILIDLDAVKIKSMTFTMPTPQQFVERFRKLLDRHHIPRASVVGHSFGSITAGWLATRCPERVSHLTLLDPVSLLLSFPEVSYSFLYRAPVKITEWIIYLMASRELTISHTLHRHFWWYNNALWLEDVPAHIGVVVGLGSHDEITNPKAVQEYVHNCAAKRRREATGPVAGVQCLMWDGYSHGQILLPTAKQAEMVAVLKSNEKTGIKM